MAARLNRMHSEQVLERIKLRQLVNRLEKNALRQLKITSGEKKGEFYLMTEGEIRSAIFLIERKLAKAVAPQDLNLHGADGGSLKLLVEFVHAGSPSSVP